jgi:phosphoribosylaminoimidazole carboxylase PurE protein
MSQPVVGILMGSLSDAEVMKECTKILKKFEIPFEIDVSSAHRTPDRTATYARQAKERGLRVIIVGAGMAAHLGGVVAAHTTLPVVAIPIDASLNGLDALLATVQMPPGIPVACMAIGKAGARNAAFFTAEILATSDDDMARRLDAHKREMEDMIAEHSRKLHEMLE